MTTGCIVLLYGALVCRWKLLFFYPTCWWQSVVLVSSIFISYPRAVMRVFIGMDEFRQFLPPFGDRDPGVNLRHDTKDVKHA